METFCLGYTHQKCDTCQSEKNWQTLNQMPDTLRLSIQKNMTSINIDKCRLTGMGGYTPAAKDAGGQQSDEKWAGK